LSWDQQLGLASPLPYAANQSGKTKIPSKNETGLDASRHTRVSAEGAEKNFLLDILFHRMSAMAIFRQQLFMLFTPSADYNVSRQVRDKFEPCTWRLP